MSGAAWIPPFSRVGEAPGFSPTDSGRPTDGFQRNLLASLNLREIRPLSAPHRFSTKEWGQENPGIHSFVPILLSIGSCFADSALEASKPRKGGRP
jgi:hypothetical protein